MTTVTISNRGRPRHEIRLGIFEAAIRLFRENGYSVSTVDQIVASAKVAKGTFFNFFPTKLDVLKAYYSQIDIEVAGFRSAMDPARPLKSLSDYACAVEAIFLREGPLLIELLDLAMSDPAMRRIDVDSGACDADEFATFLLAAQNLGLIGNHVDPVLAAETIIDLWSGAVRSWLQSPAEGHLVRSFEARVGLLFQGLGYQQ